MSKNFKVQKLQLELGPIDLNFPILNFGQGQKTIGLVVGLHGVETAGFFVIEKLFQKRKRLANKVKVILGANPSGLTVNSRFNSLDLPMDVKDPNRSFPGKPFGSVQERINDLILKEIKNCDFVLDIHNYSNLGGPFPLLALEGIAFEDFKGQLKEESLKFLGNLKSQFAFFVDAKQAEQRGFSGTLNESLNKLGTPNLGLEMPSIEFLNEKTIDQMVSSLITAINNVGSHNKSVLKLPKLINTKVTKSEQAGVFTPLLLPPCPITAGQKIGTLFDSFTGLTFSIKSPTNGLLVVVKRKNFVRVGEFLFEIGSVVKPAL